MTTNLNGTFAAVQAASRELALLSDDTINQILNAVADAAIAETPFILSENEKDLARMDKSNPKYDRLKLTEERLKGIAADTRNVATLPSPLGRILKETSRPNGMKLTKVSVPFGVIGIIYEARPNVSFDVFSLCLKSESTDFQMKKVYQSIAVLADLYSICSNGFGITHWKNFLWLDLSDYVLRSIWSSGGLIIHGGTLRNAPVVFIHTDLPFIWIFHTVTF